MKTQEIVLKDNVSDSFELIEYPDFQKSIKLNLDKLNKKIPIEIICRIKYFSELEVLLCLVGALNKNDFNISNIKFVYLYGLRSDRAFDIGQPNYTKDVIFKILRELDVNNIDIDAPHNEYIFRCNNDFHIDMSGYESEKIMDWCNDYTSDEFLLIAGDESYYEQATSYNIDFFFVKSRKDNLIDVCINDENKFKNSLGNREIIIVDDICDGGATFIAEYIYLKNKFPNNKIHLIVNHGIFSKGIDLLFDYFETITCTNSYTDIFVTSHKKRLKILKVI